MTSFVAAQAAPAPEDLGVALDTVWVLVAAVLVLFMQVGFALLEAGFTQAKNIGNIVMKKLLGFVLSTLTFFAVGFAVAFGGGNSLFGTSGWFMRGDAFDSLSDSPVPIEAKFLFQLAFAAVAVSIISGAMAERTRFKAWLLVVPGVAGLVYPLVAHWVWADGWLEASGFLDFAGSTVVHVTGGFTALVGAVMLGARIRAAGSRSGRHQHVPHHPAIILPVLGTLVLWVGWYGFNAGSTLAAEVAIGRIAMTTTLAAAGGGFSAMIAVWVTQGRPEVSMTANGVLAGLVAITAPCAYVEPWAGALIGLIAGPVLVASVTLLERVIDDPAGAVSVHGVSGLVGTLLAGVLASPRLVAEQGIGSAGLLYGGGFDQLIVQAVGAVSAIAWVLASSAVLFAVVRFTVGLRVTAAEELIGLDVSQHGDVSAQALAGAAADGTPPPGAAFLDRFAGADPLPRRRGRLHEPLGPPTPPERRGPAAGPRHGEEPARAPAWRQESVAERARQQHQQQPAATAEQQGRPADPNPSHPVAWDSQPTARRAPAVRPPGPPHAQRRAPEERDEQRFPVDWSQDDTW